MRAGVVYPLPRLPRHLRRLFGLSWSLCALLPAWAVLPVDVNQDGLGDLWQLRHGAQALAAEGDADGDGLSNAAEALAGTDPFSARSALALELTAAPDGALALRWPGVTAKRYEVQISPDLVTWTPQASLPGNDATLEAVATMGAAANLFVRVAVRETDTDGDGVTDWEELQAGYDARRVFSEGLGSNPATPTVSNPRITDLERFRAQLAVATDTVSLVAIEPELAETWPHPATVLVRRTGGLAARIVQLSLGGTATAGQDYVAPATLAVTIPLGADQVALVLPLVPDTVEEGTETLTVQLEPGDGYTIDAAARTATFTLADATTGPSLIEATRFLQQASFGPTPAELARARSLGFAAWLDEQFQRPVALHLPIVQTWYAERNTDGLVIDNSVISTEHRIEAFWRQVMRDDATSDPLRQRVAFALSQIFVISDRMSSLNNDQRGMTSYYDTLLTHAFGTYRQLLEAVTRHPWMGLYLSALRNRKANPALNRFPDENYAREVMQLFSIGLWLLNPDGTPVLSDGTAAGPDGEIIPAGQPIPTYGQEQVSEFARVFTGLSYSKRFSGSTNFTEINTSALTDSRGVPWQPMRMFDVEHDLAAKRLWLPGAAVRNLPARTASGSSAGDADLAAALDYLANHPNTGPFICHQLIQRLVTSNPTPAYVARIAAVFADNGAGVRGDLRAVIRALLLDPEARDFASALDPEHGQLREPYTRYVSLARALGVAPRDATAAGGRYRGFAGIDADFLQRPLSAPSVFNFYTPDYAPPGVLQDNGLVGPEFQILNSVTAIALPNRISSALNASSTTALTRFNSTTQSDDAATPVDESLWNSSMDEAGWQPLGFGDPDVLVTTLARALCARPLAPETFRAITRAVRRVSDPAASGLTTLQREQRALHRVRLAAHLIALTPEAAVLR